MHRTARTHSRTACPGEAKRLVGACAHLRLHSGGLRLQGRGGGRRMPTRDGQAFAPLARVGWTGAHESTIRLAPSTVLRAGARSRVFNARATFHGPCKEGGCGRASSRRSGMRKSARAPTDPFPPPPFPFPSRHPGPGPHHRCARARRADGCPASLLGLADGTDPAQIAGLASRSASAFTTAISAGGEGRA